MGHDPEKFLLEMEPKCFIEEIWIDIYLLEKKWGGRNKCSPTPSVSMPLFFISRNYSETHTMIISPCSLILILQSIHVLGVHVSTMEDAILQVTEKITTTAPADILTSDKTASKVSLS